MYFSTRCIYGMLASKTNVNDPGKTFFDFCHFFIYFFSFSPSKINYKTPHFYTEKRFIHMILWFIKYIFIYFSLVMIIFNSTLMCVFVHVMNGL